MVVTSLREWHILSHFVSFSSCGPGGGWWEPYLEHLRQYSSQGTNGNKDVSEHPIPSDSACTYEFLAVFYKLKEDVTKNFEVTPSSRALHVPRPKVPSTSLQGA